MAVKDVLPLGWTSKSATVRFWLAMDEHRQQRAQRIKRLREHRGWSAERLAQEAGLSAKTVSRLENADVDEPRGNTIRKLADALDVEQDAIRGARPSLPQTRLEERLGRIETKLDELLDQLPQAALAEPWNGSERRRGERRS